MKANYFTLLALLLGLAACTQDELSNGTLPEGRYPVVIQANGLSAVATPFAAPSRATVDGDWQGVTTVAVKIGDEVKEYTATASDTDGYKRATLSREDDPFWWTSRDPITVSAWWPFDNADITQMPDVKVAGNQSLLADFQKSDFISAIDQTVEFDDPTLEFTHRTARVVVELKPGTGFTSVAGATVSLVSLSADNGNPTAITTCNTAGETHEALAAPQTVAAGKPFIEVKLGEGTFYFRPQDDVVLEAGYRYTYTVNVNATGLTLASCEIGGWEPGQGESGVAEIVDYFYDESSNTFIVYTDKGLLAWNEAAQSDLTLNCTLTDDIDLTAIDWTPVGNNNNPYTGTFDGGGIAGQNDGTVENCSVNGTVTGRGFTDTGGVAGTNNGTVTACYHTGDVSGYDVGGLAGSSFGPMIACYWSNNIEYDCREMSGSVLLITKKVDGTDVTWLTAQSAMNTAIDAWNNSNPNNPCNWQFANATATTPPTLVASSNP